LSGTGILASGDDGDDNLLGSGSNDSLLGGQGDDNIRGNAGADSLIGGTGDDFFLYNTGDVGLGEVIDGGAAGANGDTILVQTTTDFANLTTATILTAGNIENIRITDGTAGTFLGSQLTGQAINVNGTAAGVSTLDVNVTTGTAVNLSTLLFTAAGAGTAFTTGTDVIDIDVTNAVASNITGTTLADNITGNSQIDNLSGNTGNDTITGGAGADQINPDSGSNVVNAGDGLDTVTIDGALAGDNNTVNLGLAGAANLTTVVVNSGDQRATTIQSVAGVDDQQATANGSFLGVTMVGTAAGISVNFTGGDGPDILTGNSDADTLNGGSGADTITGGAGADQMNGGIGIDRFIQTDQIDSSGSINADTINGFNSLVDKIGSWSVGNINSTTGFGDLVQVNPTNTSVSNGDTIEMSTVAGAFATGGLGANDNLIYINGNIANTDALETSLENGGGFQMTFDAGIANTNGFLVLYDDNVNSYLALVQSGAVAAGGTAASGTLTARNLVTFNGVTSNWDSNDFLAFIG
jgi:Ca2+-binding RTX toxin-like protein